MTQSWGPGPGDPDSGWQPIPPGPPHAQPMPPPGPPAGPYGPPPAGPGFGPPQNPAPFGAPPSFGPAFGTGQFGAAQFGAPPPPRRRSTALIVGVICAVVAVVCLTATLVVALWPSDDGDNRTETLQLASNVTIEVDVPSGWKTVKSNSSEYPDRYLLTPRREQRSYTEIDRQSEDLDDSGSTVQPITIVELFTLNCSSINSSAFKDSETVGDWRYATESVSRNSVSAARTLAYRTLDNGVCLAAFGLSAAKDSSDLSNEPRSFVRNIAEGKIITDVTQSR
ncbi:MULTISPECIES: hypothetical protein [unclassified Gordonia (in: high G+C Gram-positive bacteria)]|uniref:hypothetical protein n=1 Tax=unclassified Gordonia (in: high G+C Gram-positive bacteria) TaxID=2657482 RepID=UPI001F0E1155|nr:hypothetical protein [Gordonia sp. ABSL49_1]MCH5643423.1 hypothetical protein [Gordonia sp. ABSL49_1]